MQTSAANSRLARMMMVIRSNSVVLVAFFVVILFILTNTTTTLLPSRVANVRVAEHGSNSKLTISENLPKLTVAEFPHLLSQTDPLHNTRVGKSEHLHSLKVSVVGPVAPFFVLAAPVNGFGYPGYTVAEGVDQYGFYDLALTMLARSIFSTRCLDSLRVVDVGSQLGYFTQMAAVYGCRGA